VGLEEADSAAGIVALFVPGAIFPLAFAGLGVAMWRARVHPLPSGPLLVIASVLFPIGNIPDIAALLVLGNAMFVVALWPVAIAWLRQGRMLVGGAGDGGLAPSEGSPMPTRATS
jgi:hypothetical protein